jgi:glycosyltransferase involved in cell wall biosynthesis
MISALMPTHNRAVFIPTAVERFLTQDYPEKELIILNDGDPISHLLPNDPQIKYYRELPRRNHGEKINRCAELAGGELLVVWDDDDWYPADRLSTVVQAFENPTIEIVGSSTLYYQDGEKAYQYTSPKNVNWLASIAFRRSAWERHKCDPLPSGADWTFMQKIRQENPASVIDLADPTLVIAKIHSGNVCKKRINTDYVPVSWEIIERLQK